MTKKHLVLLLLLVLAVATGAASTWKIHNYYVAGNIQNVLDTGDKIYYLNSNRLFQFDKTTLTTVPLNRQNLLSDNQISQIYYDWESRLLFVAYANSNIDVIDAAGNVRNIAGIKDVVARVHDYTLTKGELTDYVDKTIRDITFGDGKAYVAMGYGYAVVDEATFAIIRDVEVLNTICVNSVARIGENLVIASNKYLYYGDPDADDPINTYAKRSGTFTDAKLFPVNDHSLLMLGNSKLVNYDFSTASPTARCSSMRHRPVSRRPRQASSLTLPSNLTITLSMLRDWSQPSKAVLRALPLPILMVTVPSGSMMPRVCT